MLRAVTVFCGSNVGRDPRHRDAARGLGEELARRGIELVYGGGRVGLMGAVADAVFAAGGRVVGVIPGFLQSVEVVHQKIAAPDLFVTETLFQRKEILLRRGDAYLTLPGGLGTLDELFEVVTLAQLGRHRKPCGLLNVLGFFDPLLEQLRRAIDSGFLDERHAAILRVHQDARALLDELDGLTELAGSQA